MTCSNLADELCQIERSRQLPVKRGYLFPAGLRSTRHGWWLGCHAILITTRNNSVTEHRFSCEADYGMSLYPAAVQLSSGAGLSLWAGEKTEWRCCFHCGSFPGFFPLEKPWIGIAWWDQVAQCFTINFLWWLNYWWTVVFADCHSSIGVCHNLEGVLTDIEDLCSACVFPEGVRAPYFHRLA